MQYTMSGRWRRAPEDRTLVAELGFGTWNVTSLVGKESEVQEVK